MVEETPATSATEFLRVARRQPLRSRALALVLNGLFYVWLAAVFCGAIYFMVQKDVPGGSAKIVLGIAVFLAALLAFPLHFLANKLGAASAVDVLRDDARSPVLFLRGFSADRDDFLSRWIKRPAALAGWRKDDGVTHEEKLVHALRSIGPVVAIGRPGEKWPTLGAARLYVADAHWRETVQRLASEAALTVIQLGDSPGLWWEVEHAIETLPPERLLLYLPTATEGKAEEAYQAFRLRAKAMHPQDLPPSCGDAAFIAFDRAWRAIFLRRDSALLFDARPPVLLFAPATASLQDSEVRRDFEALATVFSEIGPAVLLGDGDLLPPAGIQSWMPLPAKELRALPEDERWGDGPVVLRGGNSPDHLDRLRSIVGLGDPRRLLIFVPRFRGPDRAERHAALRRAVCASAPCQERFATAAAAYVFFDRAWRPQVIRRSWLASPGWLGWLRRRGRAAHRSSALLLRTLFRRHGRSPPGRWSRRLSWLMPAGLALLIGLAAAGSKGPTYELRLTAEHDIETNWQGLVWGLPADQATALFSSLDLDDLESAGDSIKNLESGRTIAVADQQLVMLLSFFRQRLVGAVLYSNHQPEAKAESLTVELSRLYGAPRPDDQGLRWEQGPIVVLLQLRDVQTSNGAQTTLYIVIQNVALVRELARGEAQG
jgi:hypothetical protein